MLELLISMQFNHNSIGRASYVVIHSKENTLKILYHHNLRCTHPPTALHHDAPFLYHKKNLLLIKMPYSSTYLSNITEQRNWRWSSVHKTRMHLHYLNRKSNTVTSTEFEYSPFLQLIMRATWSMRRSLMFNISSDTHCLSGSPWELVKLILNYSILWAFGRYLSSF